MAGKTRRRRTVPAVLLTGVLVLTAGCGVFGDGPGAGGAGSSTAGGGASRGAPGGGGPEGGGAGPAAPPRVEPAKVTVSPADGTTGVEADGPVSVAVSDGGLTALKVVNSQGEEVDGKLTADGGTWRPKVPFSLGRTYTVTATAANPAGALTVATARFTTMAPDRNVTATVFPTDGMTVGVGQPISVRFDHPVTDRAAVEKALRVTASPAVEGAWHWFGGTRADYRPRKYWKPGTDVRVDVHLRGVDMGGNAMSTQYRSVRFAIAGVARITTVDVAEKTMTTTENGKVVRTIPITAGESPKYDTWGGVMVVQEKYRVTRMDSQTVGLGEEYNIADVPYAVRITTSGTFVHGNHWYDKDDPPFGKTNTSHGCVSMTPANAKWFYDRATPGDIVKVVNTRERTVAADNGYGAWNLTWAQWLATSATGAS